MRIKYVAYLYTVFMTCFTAISCSSEEDKIGVDSVDKTENIVAGHGEPSFTEHFGLELELPISEEIFIELLESHEISFRLISPSNYYQDIPPLRHRQDLDTSEFSKAYDIYGGQDTERRVGKSFRAFVDARGMIVYIENTFSYTGP